MTSSQQGRFRAERWAATVHLALLLSLLLAVALPALDHHAVERDPGHSHTRLGDGDAYSALGFIPHHHPYEHAHMQAPLNQGQPLLAMTKALKGGPTLLFLPEHGRALSLFSWLTLTVTSAGVSLRTPAMLSSPLPRSIDLSPSPHTPNTPTPPPRLG